MFLMSGDLTGLCLYIYVGNEMKWSDHDKEVYAHAQDARREHYTSTNTKHNGERWIWTRVHQNIDYKAAALSTVLWLLWPNLR